VTLRLVGHRHGEGPRRDVTDGQGAGNADSGRVAIALDAPCTVRRTSGFWLMLQRWSTSSRGLPDASRFRSELPRELMMIRHGASPPIRCRPGAVTVLLAGAEGPAAGPARIPAGGR